MKLKLFTKFVIILGLLAVIPATIVGWRTININREGMQAAILELHTHLASYLATEIQGEIKAIDRQIQYIQRTLSTQMTWTDRQSVLQALLDTNESFASVSIVNQQGQEILKAYNPVLEKDPRLFSRADDPTFIAFWKKPKMTAISDVSFTGTDPRITVIYPLGPDHCLLTTVTLQTLWNDITQTRIASTGYAFLVNEKGQIIAHPQFVLAQNKTPATNLPIVSQVMKAVTVGSSEYVQPKTGKKIVGAYAPVKGLGWGVIIQQDKDEAYISVHRMQNQAAMLIVIAVLAAALLAYFIARGLTRPIVTITKAARRIAAKDFTSRVTVATRDELQELAETFNEMTAELERYDNMQVNKIIEEKTKTEAVIFSISDGILMTDRDGRLQLVNANARELIGIPDSGWQGQPLASFDKNPVLMRTLQDVLATSHGMAGSKEVALSSGDLMRYYRLFSGEVTTPDKHDKIGFVTVLRNITLEKELDRMKEDFLHSITHDLRNPMTSIRGFLKFLIDGVAGPVTDQQKKMLGTMDRASLRLLGLINDILDIAKLESGTITVNLAPADLRMIAQKTLEISEGSAMKKSIKLVLECPEDLAKIQCDPELMERVFLNLVGNAIKFTPENGTITIRLRETGNDIEAAVCDTGEGIPPEYLNKIFDKFQQVAGQRKGGTGLGLTICKHVVEAHRGQIWVESKLGEGARFIFTVPRTLTLNMLQNK
jgi:NtrC-family two-component system sensor histidine kinase KinB